MLLSPTLVNKIDITLRYWERFRDRSLRTCADKDSSLLACCDVSTRHYGSFEKIKCLHIQCQWSSKFAVAESNEAHIFKVVEKIINYYI
jgi:hypothetical protein